MIQVQNVRIEGNNVFIRSTPIAGIIALTSFVDDSAGEDDNNQFVKTFRYSKNGITFTDWQDLTVPNILAISVSASDTFIIELNYKKNPIGSTQLVVTNASIDTTDALLTDTDLFKNSIFYQFFGSNNVEVLNWMINVLDKLFQKGLLPNYMDRYNDIGSPEDFIEFWGSVCKFFAYYVIYARKYQKFYEDERLLAEYLEERGLKTSKHNDLSQLQTMMQNYYREIAVRGTKHILDQEGEFDNNGELRRLIDFIHEDEFLFNRNKSEHAGWNLDNSSPNYRSVTIHDNFNKFYEKGEQPQNISKYPVTGIVSIITDNTINKKVFSLSPNSSIGQDPSFAIPIDPYLDYEFSFFIRKTAGENLTVGFDALDKNGSYVDLLSRVDGSVSNNFLELKELQRTDKYLYCRFFLYNKLKPLYAYDNVSLKMTDDVKYVIPKIRVEEGSALVYNIRFLPMALPYSKGFIQINNFIDCYLKNNNSSLSINEVTNFIKKYLISYSDHIKIIETNNGGDYSLETYIPSNALLEAPTVITTPLPDHIPVSYAELGGEVTDDGGSWVNERGIVWSTSPNPTIADNRVIMGTGTGLFSQVVTGLPTGMIYVRAYAINAVGIGYGEEEATSAPVTIDQISVASANPSNADTIDFTLVFSEAIEGLTADNLGLVLTGDIAGAAILSITGSGDTYTVTVGTGAGTGTIGLNLINDTGLSLPLTNEPFTGEVYTIDRTAPTVTITSHPSSNTNSTTGDFTFAGVDTGGAGLSHYLVSIDGGAETIETSPFHVEGLSNGSHTFNVKAVDNLGNVGSPAIFTWNIDTAPLTVVINRKTPNPPDGHTDTTWNTITFRATFNKNVTGVDLSDFLATVSGSVVAPLFSINPISASVYDIALFDVDGTGTLRLDLKAINGIQDAFGNTIGSTLGQVYTITLPRPVDNMNWSFTPAVALDSPDSFSFDANGVPSGINQNGLSSGVVGFGSMDLLRIYVTGPHYKTLVITDTTTSTEICNISGLANIDFSFGYGTANPIDDTHTYTIVAKAFVTKNVFLQNTSTSNIAVRYTDQGGNTSVIGLEAGQNFNLADFGKDSSIAIYESTNTTLFTMNVKLLTDLTPTVYQDLGNCDGFSMVGRDLNSVNYIKLQDAI